jgi:hypothetical protein
MDEPDPVIDIDLTDPAWTFFDQPPRLIWPGGGPPTEEAGRVTDADIAHARQVAGGDVLFLAPNHSVLLLTGADSPWFAGLIKDGWTLIPT